VRNGALANQRAADDEDPDVGGAALHSLLLGWLLRNPRDSIVAIIATAAVAAIVINGLFLQPGPHPAPIFSVRPSPIAAGEATGGITPMLPRPRPTGSEGGTVSARTRAEITADVQRELTRRGYYDGPVDGIYGAKTDAAIRDFEHTADLRASLEPNEALLQAIVRSAAKVPASVRDGGQKEDAISTLLAPSRQIMAVQRALSDYAYGPVKTTGVYDADTRASIERFERDRKLPITGQISERIIRELAALTGRPLE
jgi:peptidoglycan hydrolase-like protein with peptidoglycan-binding domain